MIIAVRGGANVGISTDTCDVQFWTVFGEKTATADERGDQR